MWVDVVGCSARGVYAGVGMGAAESAVAPGGLASCHCLLSSTPHSTPDWQAISFIAALLGKQGTPQDALPRSFAAFRRERQLQRQQRRQIQDDGEDFEDDDVEAAGSTIRWPILVVCPTSVLDNWVRELNMWGTFKVCAGVRVQGLVSCLVV